MSIEYSIVIPVYNSGDWLPELVNRISYTIESFTQNAYEIILVNDCSPKTNVWPVIEEICREKGYVIGVNMQYNCGQFIATLCGLDLARGKYVITMDDDLQHLPEELPKLINAMVGSNFECVFGVFEHKEHASMLRRLGSWLTNSLVTHLYKRPKGIKSNSLRIMTNKLAKQVCSYKGAKPQITPLIFMSTKKVGNVLIKHNKREYGESGYTTRALITSTWNTIVNASTLPLDIVSRIGLFFSIIAFIIGIFYLIMYMIGDIAVAGFTATILVIVFFCGLILFSIGILGKYIERIIKELTGFPRYTIGEILNNKEDEIK